MKISLAEALVRTLHVAGVKAVFGVPGGYTSALLDAFSRSGMITVRSVHEGAAAFAAAGYAQASGELAVVFAQGGPGTTNLITGVAAAFTDGVPMLVLASQAPGTEYSQDGHQEARGVGLTFDQLEMFRTMAGQIYRPPTATAALRCVRQAISLALADRTPAVIDLAVDVAAAHVEFADLSANQFIARSQAVDLEAVERVAAMLHEARNPVILIGDKIAHRGCTSDLEQICDQNEIALVCADFAKGVVADDHPMFAGVLGQSGHESAAQLVRDADLVIALGTRLSVQTTIGYEEGLFERLVQIEERALEIARNVAVDFGAVSSLPHFVRALRKRLGDRKPERGLRARVAELKAKHAVYAEDITRRDPMNTPTALRVIREHIPRETLIVGDCGLNLQYLKRHFPIFAPDGFFNLYGLGAMGAAVPLALGVKRARPSTPVLSIIGDGGMMVYPGELAVAAEYELPVIIVVMNNRGYLQVGDRLERYFGTRNACSLPDADFVAMATSMGVAARRASDTNALASAIDWALGHSGPTLIEAEITGDTLDDMTLPRTRVLQDQWFKREPLRPPWPFPSR